MKKWIFSVLYASLALLGLYSTYLHFRMAGAWTGAPFASLFDTYPYTEPFDWAIRFHLHPAGSGLLYSTSFFDGNPENARACRMTCHVDANGKGYLASFNWNTQNANYLQLDSKQLTALQSALRSLPPSSVRPPIDKLLILSYQSDNFWVTRLYDKERLPRPVQRVYKIVRDGAADFKKQRDREFLKEMQVEEHRRERIDQKTTREQRDQERVKELHPMPLPNSLQRKAIP